MTCPKCNATVRDDAKFCTSCGEKFATNITPRAENTAQPVSMVKQKLTWNIQPGEIARRINETEFVQYDSATGIIINEGTTAYITANGNPVAELHGGSYNFIDAKKLNSILEQRKGGLLEGLKKGGRFFVNLVMGTKVRDKIAQNNPNKDQFDSVDKIVEHLRKNELLSLTLKLDKGFQLLFGDTHANRDDYANFKPMTIKTKVLDTNMGMRAFFKITDFKKFAQYYLTDRNFVTSAMLADELTPLVKNAIQEELKDIELTDSFIPQDVIQRVFAKISDLSNDILHGITIEKIIEVTSDQKDLERFRELSKELYLSEKELEYLIRTNDFRNRLATEENVQAVHEAKTDLDLHKKLSEVNSDRLVHDDDLEKFYMLVSREKRIREAKNEDEVAAAFSEISKNELLRQEDVDNIRIDIFERKNTRAFSISIADLGNDIEYRRKKLEQEDIELESLRKRRLGVADIDIEEMKKRDGYQHQKETDARKSKIELDGLEMQQKMDLMKQMKEMEQTSATHQQKLDLETQAQQQKHQLDLRNSIKDMTPEQMAALAASENFDSENASKFVEMLSAKYNADQQKEFMDQYQKLTAEKQDQLEKLSEQQRGDAKENLDRMERMMQMMMENSATMTGHLVQNKDQMKNEYKERAIRQEDRTDAAQDKALNYTTRQHQKAEPKKATNRKNCKSCQEEVEATERFCGSCGNEA
jgi:hypothetical protein